MKRSNSTSGLAKALVLAALFGAVGCSQGESRPNVILVVVDTLRADHTSLGTYQRDTTPEISEYFAGGTVFESASSTSSWTLPSMAMTFTGAYRLANEGDLGEDEKTLSVAFQAAGYQTGAVVANPLLGPYKRTNPQTKVRTVVDPGFGQGFDFFDVTPPWKNHQEHNWYARELVNRGTSWVDSKATGDRPFFLWLHFFDPHFPRDPQLADSLPPLSSPARFESFEAAVRPSSRHLFTEDVYRGIEEEIAKYDEEVLGVDAAMGDLFTWLEATGLAENTIVVFTSDHGEGLWTRAPLSGEVPKKSNPFPPLYDDHGTQVYSEQVHVPLALSGPGIASGLRVKDSISLIDLAPTLYELCDLPYEPEHSGRSLLQEDRFGSLAEPSEVFSICSRSLSLTLEGRWRLHLPAAFRRDEQGALPELYDLSVDPLELQTVDDPARIAAMSARIETFGESLAGIQSGGAKRTEAERAARRELLDSLGYIDQ